MRKIGLIILLAVLLINCGFYRLEKKLNPEVRSWYDQHYILMETKVPDFINIKQPTERKYFLKLSQELKEQYIQYFWYIRHEEARELFYERVEVANQMFSYQGTIGWKTDMGQLFVLCGAPSATYIYMEDEEGDYSPVLGGALWDYSRNYVQIWLYTVGGRWVQYYFGLDRFGNWRKNYEINFLRDTSGQRELENYWMRLLSPTEDNWWQWWGMIRR